MRAASLAGAVLLGFGAPALAQAPADWVYKRDYTFERLEAAREVHDSSDNGTIRLATYVWRPVKNDRREVVLFSHGSTNGMTMAPNEPEGMGRAYIQFFVERGYTFVFPMRRGRGASTGTYVEECSTAAKECTIEEFMALTDRGLTEALRDDEAVIDQLILGRLAAPGSKILLVGQSRGGYLSLVLAGQRPELVKGVVNFSGAWVSMPDRAESQLQERLSNQAPRLTAAAKRASMPTLWIYADRDPFYGEAGRQGLLKAWRDGGGKAEYLFIGQHSLANGHLALQNPPLWSQQIDAFLATLR